MNGTVDKEAVTNDRMLVLERRVAAMEAALAMDATRLVNDIHALRLSTLR